MLYGVCIGYCIEFNEGKNVVFTHCIFMLHELNSTCNIYVCYVSVHILNLDVCRCSSSYFLNFLRDCRGIQHFRERSFYSVIHLISMWVSESIAYENWSACNLLQWIIIIIIIVITYGVCMCVLTAHSLNLW